MKALRVVRWVSCAVMLFSSASFAVAQEAEPPIRKRSSSTDPYAAIGIDAGGLRLYPSIEFGTLYTSNVRRSSTVPDDDFGLELKPSLRFESEWSRHSWTGSASGDWMHYTNFEDLSTLTGTAETTYRLDIRRSTKADFTSSITVNETGVENNQVPNTAISPRRDYNYVNSAKLTHDFGGVEGSAKISLARSTYEDVPLSGGGVETNKDRNYWAPTLTLRAGLSDDGPAFKPFVELAYMPRFHDQTLDRNGLARNSQGASVSAGVALNRAPFWEGDVALSYVLRNYADASLANVHGIGVNGRVKWSPTDLSSLEATSNFTIDETSTLGVSASRSWANNIELTQEFRRNITGKAGMGWTVQDSGLGIDYSTSAKLGVEWKLNQSMTAAATYQGLWFNSSAANGDYNDQRVMTSIVLKR